MVDFPDQLTVVMNQVLVTIILSNSNLPQLVCVCVCVCVCLRVRACVRACVCVR